MEIRFVKPEEVQQLARNVQTAFPSKTPQALLDNMPGSWYIQMRDGTWDVLMRMEL